MYYKNEFVVGIFSHEKKVAFLHVLMVDHACLFPPIKKMIFVEKKDESFNPKYVPSQVVV